MGDISSPGGLMDHLHHILVTDETGEKPSNQVFLLKLAGFRVSEFDNELEVCNWLLQNDPGPAPASLLLLNRVKSDRSLFLLLSQIRQRFSSLEILLVTPEVIPLQRLNADFNPPVHQCRVEEAAHFARRIFSQVPLTDPLPV